MHRDRHLRKIAVIARREYLATVRTRSFLLAVLLMPALIVGSVAVQTWLARRGASEDKTVVVFDHSGALIDGLEAAAAARGAEGAAAPDGDERGRSRFTVVRGDPADLDDELRLALSARIRGGELAAFVEIGARILEAEPPGPSTMIAYHAESLAFSELRRWLEQTARQRVLQRRLLAAGIAEPAIERALAPVVFEGSGLLSRGADGQLQRTDAAQAIAAEFAPLGLLFLLFNAILLTAQPALQAVIEEKQQRIAEVLLGSVAPFDLMLGKLLGYVLASLTVLVVYLLAAGGLAQHYGLLGLLAPALIAWVVAYVAVAVLLYGAIFVAIGAAVNDLKESQNLMLPAMLVIMAPLFVWSEVVAEPLGQLATGLSLFPMITPLIMPMRLAVTGAVPMWQPALGLVLTALTALLVVVAAGRIFRVGILAYGKAPTLRELARWALLKG